MKAFFFTFGRECLFLAKNNYMIRFLLIVCFSLTFLSVNAQIQVDNKSAKANRYFHSRDYKNAAPLFKELYYSSGITSYFDNFVISLIMNSQYDEAEKELKKILKTQPRLIQYHVLTGYLYQQKGDQEKADSRYKVALRKLPPRRLEFNSLLNAFIRYGLYSWAKKCITRAEELMPEDQFYYERSRIYRLQRNYEKMMDELLSWLYIDEKRISSVRNYINAVFYQDDKQETKDLLRQIISKRVQAKPTYVPFQRLMTWYNTETSKLNLALSQAVALDQKTEVDDMLTLTVARAARKMNNKEVTLRAYKYLINKGSKSPVYMMANIEKLKFEFDILSQKSTSDSTALNNLVQSYDKTIKELGINRTTYELILNQAHLLTFFQKKPTKAVAILEEAQTTKGLPTSVRSQIKLKLADVCLFNNDPWQAILYYSQVIDRQKNSPIADEAKWKKARLGFFTGDFEWAKAQLDAIKGSTSKFTSNDAIDLSLLIASNTNLDTTRLPMQIFARAEFLIYTNQLNKALTTLDSIQSSYPYHSLTDECHYRKAEIYTMQEQFEKAQESLQFIIDNYPDDLLADNAIFMQAELYERLNNTSKAGELYKEILLKYPGSLLATDARKRYRQLTQNKTR
ncbi:tetratricopeptide repeat protein [Puteibacter caeruleilacunae]|nr:tetratricopeptide repeat protein [Puteibacter caeruleilacunae]